MWVRGTPFLGAGQTSEGSLGSCSLGHGCAGDRNMQRMAISPQASKRISEVSKDSLVSCHFAATTISIKE